MAISKVAPKKPRKLTLTEKSAKKESVKANKISKPSVTVKKPGTISVKALKNLEVKDITKQNVSENVIKTSKKIKGGDKTTKVKNVASRKKANKGTNVIKDISETPLVSKVKTAKAELTESVEAKEIVAPKRSLKRKHPIVTNEVGNNDEKDDNPVVEKCLKKKLVTQKTAEKQSTKANLQKSKEKQKLSTDVAEDKKKENVEDVCPVKLTKVHILECISAVFHLTEEQVKKNSLFAGDAYPIFMQVTCIRIPKTPRRQIRIVLPHSLASEKDEVALFVKDLERGRRKDYEQTIEHYRNVLNEHGCTRVKGIIPINQVKTEYDQYELKRKLVALYDHFLVDGRITGHISHLLGKVFTSKRKLPTPLRMDSKDLKHEIDHALLKTSMQMHSNGNTHLMQIGTTHMKAKHILENIQSACENLKKVYPGGWDNIQSIRIKGATTLALPIYVTLKNKNSVEVPVVQPRRPKAYTTVKGELTTLPGDATVTVTPEGDISLEVTKEDSSDDEEITTNNEG